MDNLKNTSFIHASQGNQNNQGGDSGQRIQQLISERNRKMDLIKSTSEEIRGLDRQISELRRATAPAEQKQEVA